jgi:hypothetical protein
MGSSFAANNFNQRKDSDSTDKNKKKVKRVKKTLKTANASEIKMAEEGETEKPVIKLKKKKKVVSLEKQISASINIFD